MGDTQNLLDATLEDGKYLEGMTRNVENLASIFPGIATALAVKFESLITKIDSIQVVSQAYKAMFLLVNAGDISFYGPAGRYAMLYNEFGFDAADDNTSEGGSHGNVVTYEYVTTKNPEIIFLLDRGAAIGEEVTLDDVKNNAAIMATNAGQNQRVYDLSPSAWYLLTGGFTSTEVMISDFDEFIISHTE
ncbi:MAG: hypothetical protein IH571_05305 [Acholeplasmataceae bacterium]|nr:hypothetical protein [Acholeplasmataceae bacterium]